MMAYANAGDLDGVTRVSNRYESSGFELGNAPMNSSLTAILYGTDLRHKDVLNSLVAEIIRGSPIADRVSYNQAISACEKYGLLDEIKKLQDGLLSNKMTVKKDILSSRQDTIIGEQEIKDRKIVNPTETVGLNTDAILDRQKESLRAVVENASINESTLASSTVHKVLVPFSPRHTCAIPVENMKNKSNLDFFYLLRKYSQLGDAESVRKILNDHALPPTTSLTNYIIRAHTMNRDPISAQGVADKWKAAGNHFNHETVCILCDAYARGSDPAGAEQVAREAREAGFKPGYHYLCLNHTAWNSGLCNLHNCI